MKVGIKLGKVKKFGIGWCIPHRVVADNAEGIGLRVVKVLLSSSIYCDGGPLVPEQKND